MIFILIRSAPFFIPILYFFLAKLMFYQTAFLFWFIFISVLINLGYFWLIYLKKSKTEIWFWLIHSWIFLSVGFLYILILSSNLFINLFIFLWSIVYFIYLESIFHYFYETKKVTLMDLKNIIAYLNLIIFFFLVAILVNFYIFLDWRAWAVILLSVIPILVLLANQLKINRISAKKIILYSLVLTVVLVEILSAILFLSVSFYVSAAAVSLLYYLLISFSILKVKEELTKGLIWQYLIFAGLVVIIIALTAQWL